ncbi:hypothetical protein FOZ63_031415, partial [Perkinsus olseni]
GSGGEDSEKCWERRKILRERQVEIGKATQQYEKYRAEVSPSKRRPGVHPVTPDASKRFNFCMHARTVCRTFCTASTGSETAVTSLVSATRDVALKTMAEKQGANRARTLLKLTRDLSDERDPARPRRSVPKGGFKAQLIHHAIAATKLVGHDELSADANDRGKKGQRESGRYGYV